MSEDTFRNQVADFLDLSLPPPWRWSIFPAEGTGDVRRGAKLKRAGLKAGWPDIFLLHPAGEWRAIELKIKNGRLSPEQVDFISYWAPARCNVSRSLSEIEDALSAWGVPLKARISA